MYLLDLCMSSLEKYLIFRYLSLFLIFFLIYVELHELLINFED